MQCISWLAARVRANMEVQEATATWRAAVGSASSCNGVSRCSTISTWLVRQRSDQMLHVPATHPSPSEWMEPPSMWMGASKT